MTPSRILLYCVAALAVLGLLAGIWPRSGLPTVFLVATTTLFFVAGWDAYAWRHEPALRIERQIQSVWPVAHWQTIHLTLHNEDRRPLRMHIIDAYPVHWEMEGMPRPCQIAPGAFVRFPYRLRPPVRGNAQFDVPYLRIASRFHLWWHAHRIGPAQSVKVFPDFSQLLGHSLTATDRRAPTAGSIRKRRRGEGTDFRQLREYRQGDSMRSIDWKATARLQKPIAREYQEERDQQVIFLLDTGRRMLARDETGSHFDHALNAVLTLGFLAQKQGDAIGLMSFGGTTRWLSPQKGRSGLDRLLSGVYDLYPHEVAPDYTLAASNLLTRLSKRAFVVMITNVHDEDDQALRTACELLSTRHLVICASMREKALDQALTAPVAQFDEALRVAASAHYLQLRQTAIKRLGIRASNLIDITPEQLSLTLVNRYWDIKESGQL
jgi:uncharacterized protein (DUF58 family)